MADQSDPVLRYTEAAKIVGLSRRTVARHVNNGTFPRPIRLTGKPPYGAVGWRRSTIEAWLAQREAAFNVPPEPTS